ncbi:hypothetical protein SEA_VIACONLECTUS_85 [Gordonia phage ViaConlectus]|uniref:Uncharacterized protein n=1 Tax=Gordonia phage ViaConlectus TaxID=2972515 RepID=A0A976YFU4_9CAUD|nr:hypothetical protein SEA_VIACONLECTUS_85 [Gordonia phage ViaConlectus]
MTMPTIWKNWPPPPRAAAWSRDRLNVRPRTRGPYEHEAFTQSPIAWQLWFWDHGTTTDGMWRMIVEADDLFHVQVLVDQIATLSRQYHDLDKSHAIARAVHWLNWKAITDALGDVTRESTPDARPRQPDAHGLYQQQVGTWPDGAGPWA